MRRRTLLVSAALVGALPLGIGLAGSEAADVAIPRPLCLGKQATIVGTARTDDLVGTKRGDVIAALGGADTVSAVGGGDLVCGGPGDDILNGGVGADHLNGGAGFDTCRAAERRAACEETRLALPSVVGAAIAPGEYLTDKFRPRLVLTFDRGWYLDHVETPVTFDLRDAAVRQGSFVLTFDSYSAAQSVAKTIERLTSLPGTSAGAPSAVTVGGVRGQEVLVTVTAANVAFPGMAEHYNVDGGTDVRFIIVAVAGKTVTIAAAGDTGKLDTFAALVDALLVAVEWRS